MPLTRENVVVHINAWPGSGKLTIARLLAKRLGGRLMDNHTLLNPAEALFDRSSTHWLTLRRELRKLAFAHMAKVETGMPIVLTDALAEDDHDRAMFDDCRPLAAVRDARLIAVVLECEEDENARRLQSPGRTEAMKLTKPQVLRDLRSRYRLLRPVDVDIIDLDVTTLEPSAACIRLEELLTRGAQ
jgi:AAA domain